MTRVINIRSGEPYDVLIDRTTPFGNPFKTGNRFYKVRRFQEYINEPDQSELRARVKRELKGKILGCWCKPLICHGDVLAKIADES